MAMSRSKRFRALAKQCEMTQRGASKFLAVGERTSRRWWNGEAAVPLAVIMLLELMTKQSLDPHDLRRLAGEPAKKGVDFRDLRRK